jgi:adenine/guanine phosphoribosyltransferase-like PRPP-binding protein
VPAPLPTAAQLAAAPHLFWQALAPAGSFDPAPAGGHLVFYPASLPDGRQLALPIRPREGGASALASLILNQCSFAVLDALAEALAEAARPLAPEVVVGIPTLGLPLAEAVARRLGHDRMVALGTSRKFWYDAALSEPMRSVTSPGQEKTLYLDPRMQPLLDGRRLLLVDDVISTGASMLAACRLLGRLGRAPHWLGAAMLQSQAWRATLAAEGIGPGQVLGVLETPRLRPAGDGGGGWIAEA